MLTKEQKQELPKTALIDSDWMIYRVGFASEDGEEDQAKARLTKLLTDVVYFDIGAEDYEAYLSGSTNFRFDIAKTVPYKGNRDSAKRPKHYDLLRHQMQRLGAKVTEDEEADDRVAIRMGEGEFVLIGVDKDLLQIPGYHWNPVKKELQFISEFDGLKNFYTQLLTGDRIDNIVGLKGIGPVKAAKILKDCTSEAELLEAAKQAYEKAGEPLERLIENARLLWLRRKEGELWELPN